MLRQDDEVERRQARLVEPERLAHEPARAIAADRVAEAARRDEAEAGAPGRGGERVQDEPAREDAPSLREDAVEVRLVQQPLLAAETQPRSFGHRLAAAGTEVRVSASFARSFSRLLTARVTFSSATSADIERNFS